ncbi:MAG TPA: penicillin-insensitive murein endopeptidase [Alphaproteobacteria bacterium]|nr:penicillin-insensitive murein endopeptidase [Alphaproteobacteria bacterium]
MGGRSWRAAAVGLATAFFLSGPALGHDAGWDAFRTPSTGDPAVIGSYANGCVAGASALTPEGAGYQVIRLGRNRFYGHPELVDFIERFGRQVAAAGIGTVLVGDMGQPRGGPMPSGHASHQSGLDVDFWLRLDLPALPRPAREDLEAVVMIDRARYEVDPTVWGDAQAELIRLAARDPQVARIFLHPALKRDLCRRDWPDRSWLRVVRPWFGHDAHFHVRLACPADSPDCVAQDPPPPGDGCGAELASWIPDVLPVPAGPAPEPEPPAPKLMPLACAAVAAPSG